MNSHAKKENGLQTCYEQGYFDPIVRKDPYCASQAIFDSGCIGENVVPSASEKEVLGNQVLESPPLAADAFPSTGLCDVARFSNGQFHAIQFEGKPVAAVNSSARRKRKRRPGDSSNEETDEFKTQLCTMLEANSQVLAAHLQSQNVNSQLDRNQRKEHMDSLVGVLGKLADALIKIADRL